LTYWDASALVPSIVREPSAALREEQLRGDPRMIVWWGSRVECASALNRLRSTGCAQPAALNRLRRSGALSDPHFRDAMRKLETLIAADAFQLAAALVASGEDTAKLPFLTGDDRLKEAAEREGFLVG
jgi:predicted nucleic acid-binding protein